MCVRITFFRTSNANTLSELIPRNLVIDWDTRGAFDIFLWGWGSLDWSSLHLAEDGQTFTLSIPSCHLGWADLSN